MSADPTPEEIAGAVVLLLTGARAVDTGATDPTGTGRSRTAPTSRWADPARRLGGAGRSDRTGGWRGSALPR